MLSIKRGFTIWEFIVVVVIIALLAAVLFPVFGTGPHGGSKRATCQSNLKQIGLGFMQYVQDYDAKFPPISLGEGQGWAKITQPYLKSWQIFRCPAAESEQGETTDYFYNAELARFRVENLAMAPLTVMLGDGAPNSPTNTAVLALLADWKEPSSSSPRSPIKRHLDGANYAFADGHVKWLKPERITMDSPRKSTNPTFLPR